MLELKLVDNKGDFQCKSSKSQKANKLAHHLSCHSHLYTPVYNLSLGIPLPVNSVVLSGLDIYLTLKNRQL